MSDIRIITGKGIAPDYDTVRSLSGAAPRKDMQTELDLRAVYDRLFPQVKMHIRPKAVCTITSFAQDEIEAKKFLCVMLTLGNGISRLIDRQTAKEDMLSAVVSDAMADSCLFAFEKQLLPMLRRICLEEGFGIKKRLEIPLDVPIEMQKEIYSILDAGRTLGLSMTSGYMLEPVKSMCLLFALTKDTDQEEMYHDCSRCGNRTCGLRKEETLLLRVKTDVSEKPKQIPCKKGENLLEVLQRNQMPIPAFCGGSGICGKCGVLVTEGKLPVTAEDRSIFSGEELEAGMRLACKAVLQENLGITVKQQPESRFAALGTAGTEYIRVHPQNPYKPEEYGIAIDIGTTTLAFSLLKLENGEIVATDTRVNSQRRYGADVISRIQAANHGKTAELSMCIQRDIRAGIRAVKTHLPEGGKGQISHIVIAGNSVMLHLLRGYSCQGFCSYPFAPVTLEPENLTLEELLFGLRGKESSDLLAQNAEVTLLPGLSAFVGADITAGLFACEMEKQTGNILFLDLGTNGEMALKAENRIYTASTAAGPAFEGGNIKWGMGSVPGAISGVRFLAGELQIKTIGGEPPEGICGTGVIESVAELLTAGVIDATGKLSEPYFTEGYPLGQNCRREIIRLMQSDIREIQMAKAAIRAGIEVLCKHGGISCDEIERVYLAGGFGYFLDIKKAAAIGIIPQELEEKTIPAGNTALKGALQFLEEPDFARLEKIRAQTEEVVLAEDDGFEELYVHSMYFKNYLTSRSSCDIL